MKNPKYNPYFPLSEYIGRIDRLRQAMERCGIDAVILAGQNNVEYTSGILHGGWAHGFAEGAMCVIVTAQEDTEPVLIMPEGLKGCSGTSAFSDIRFVRDFLGGDGIEAIKVVLEQNRLTGGRLGIENSRYERMGLTGHFMAELNSTLDKAKLVDATDMMYSIRAIKSPLEIEKVRAAVKVTSDAYEVALPQIKEGMSEKELGQIIASEMAKCGDSCVRSPWFIFIHADGKSPIGWDGVPSDYRFKKGDCIYIDSGFCYQGYTADFIRIASVGEPSKEKSRLYYGARDANMALINHIRPGMKCKDLYAYLREKMLELGFEKEVRLQDEHRYIFSGHGIGLGIHEPPALNDVNEETVEVGMTMAIEGDIFSSLPFSDNTIALKNEENILITQTGAKLLTTLNNDIWIARY